MQTTAEVRAAEIEREHRALCAGYGRLLALIGKADEEQDGLLLGHGGTTSLANLVLLCRRHHTDVHYRQRLDALEPVPTTVPAEPANASLALAC